MSFHCSRHHLVISLNALGLSRIYVNLLPRFRGGHCNGILSPDMQTLGFIDRQRANSCMCCCPKLTFMLRSKSWLRTPTLAMDIAFGLTMSRMDSINKRILPLRCNKCQYTVEIFTRLALCRFVWLLAK